MCRGANAHNLLIDDGTAPQPFGASATALSWGRAGAAASRDAAMNRWLPALRARDRGP
jgi:hypothetical protein